MSASGSPAAKKAELAALGATPAAACAPKAASLDPHGDGPHASGTRRATGAEVAADPDTVLQPLAEVAARQDLAELAERLGELRRWLAADLDALEAELGAEGHCLVAGNGGAQTRVGLAAAHLLHLPGKRIRPLCVMLAARLGGRAMDRAVRGVATACELVHAATLLHDDVVDDSQERRGSPAARVIYGNSASILAGDHLLVHALRLVQDAGAPQLLPSLLAVMARMVRAEALQLERRGRFEPSRETYLEVIRGKTAALFAWGLTAGGELAGCPDDVRGALGRVGEHLGMAFQLTDDVLDLDGEAGRTGKDALRDVREGKLTWPLILAAEREPALAARLARVAAGTLRTGGSDAPSPEAHARELRDVQVEVHRSGALEATRAFAQEQASAACACLEALPAGRPRDALGWVVRSAVARLG